MIQRTVRADVVPIPRASVPQSRGVPIVSPRPVTAMTIPQPPNTARISGQTPNHCVPLGVRSRTASDGSAGLT